ncbi:MAG: transposase [Gemmataceae bacterium]|nr:transposase [Gemmataceae bacterium]
MSCTVDMRLVFNTIFYVNKTGCQWAMLPQDLATRSTALVYFNAWKKDGTWQKLLETLRRQVRTEAVGQD